MWFIREKDGKYCVVAGTAKSPGDEVECFDDRAEAEAKREELLEGLREAVADDLDGGRLTEAGMRAACGWMGWLQEESRVLSSANKDLVRRIAEEAQKMQHHPGTAKILALVEELLRRAARPETAPPDGAAEGKGKPAGKKAPAMREGGAASLFDPLLGRITEAVELPGGPKGSRWGVVAITSGVSINGRYWPPDLLESPEFLAMLEGVDVYEDHAAPEDARKYPVGQVGRKIGRLVQPRAVRVGDKVEVQGILEVVDQKWRENLLNANDLGMLDSYIQLSINARGEDPVEIHEGRRVNYVRKVHAVPSVDAVTRASAGGRLTHLLESVDNGGEHMDPKELEKLLKQAAQAGAEAALSARTAADAAPVAEAPEASAPDAAPATQPTPQPAADAPAAPAPASPAAASPAPEASAVQEQIRALNEAIARFETRERQAANERMISEAVKGAKLGGPIAEAATEALTALGASAPLTEAQITPVLERYRKLAESFSPQMPEVLGDITEQASPRGDFYLRLQQTFLGNRPQWRLAEADRTEGDYGIQLVKDAEGKVVKPFNSLREAFWTYRRTVSRQPIDPYSAGMAEAILGEMALRSFHSVSDHDRITEAMTTATFGELVQDSMYMTMMRHYEALPYDDWRRIVSVTENLADFRNRHHIRVGGYGDDLPIVGENSAYQPLGTVSDEEVAYAPQKRGALEDTITLELVANDNLNALSRIPQRLAEVSKRTLYKFVFSNLLLANPVMGYDSVTLFHDVTHANSHAGGVGAGSVPSVSALNAVCNAMEGQAPRLASGDIIGEVNKPRFVIGHRNQRGIWQRILSPSDAYAYGLTPAATTPGANIDTDTNLDPHYFKGAGIDFVAYQFAATATVWVAVADPMKVDTIALGFFAGRQEPELFMQNDPSQGQTFAKDSHALKVRHIYGGAPMDHTSFYRGNS